MKRTILTLSSVVLILAACHKTENKTTAQKIIGKWDLVSDDATSTYPGSTPNVDNYTGQPGDYSDFRTDGKVYRHDATGGSDTVVYKVLSDKYVLIDGDSNEIKTLTDNSMVLYYNQTYSYGGTYTETVTLKK